MHTGTRKEDISSRVTRRKDPTSTAMPPTPPWREGRSEPEPPWASRDTPRPRAGTGSAENSSALPPWKKNPEPLTPQLGAVPGRLKRKIPDEENRGAKRPDQRGRASPSQAARGKGSEDGPAERQQGYPHEAAANKGRSMSQPVHGKRWERQQGYPHEAKANKGRNMSQPRCDSQWGLRGGASLSRAEGRREGANAPRGQGQAPRYEATTSSETVEP